MPEKVKLVPRGFPWTALALALLVLAVTMLVLVWLGFPMAGAMVVGWLIAFAAFALLLR